MTRRAPAAHYRCKWFAVCQRQATHYRNAFKIGSVPMCDECGALYARHDEQQHEQHGTPTQGEQT